MIVKSFARIHETNLKKQGMLPLTFANPDDYDLVGPRDKISILGLATLAPGKQLTVKGTRPSGETYTFKVNHTFNGELCIKLVFSSCRCALVMLLSSPPLRLSAAAHPQPRSALPPPFSTTFVSPRVASPSLPRAQRTRLAGSRLDPRSTS